MPTTSPLEIEERRAGFTALRGEIDAQMRGREITAEIFPIESRDHSETGRFRQIERITDRDHGRGEAEFSGFSDGQERRLGLHLQERDPAAQIGHQLGGVIFFALELHREIIRFAADRIGGVDGAGRINEKAGAGKLAVFIDGVDLDDRLATAFEDRLDLAADRAGRVLLARGGRGRSG